MIWTSNRSYVRAGLTVGAMLVFCWGINLRAAQAQEATGAPLTKADLGRIETVLKGLNRGRYIGQVAVSPDGKRLAWIQRSAGGEEIRVAPMNSPMNLDAGERVTAAARPEEHCQENEMAWAPDSKALAFLSDCGSSERQMNLYLSKLDGDPARRLANLKGYVESPAFSPDGTKVAFLYVEGATRPAGALAAMKLPAGVIGEDGIEIQRVAVAKVAQPGLFKLGPGALEMASPANLHVYEFDWRPDSKGLAYVAADPPGENNWWVAKLYTQVLGGVAKAILAPATVDGALHGLQIAVPRWSPDGKAIAFIGGLMSDQGATGGDVWIVAADGGAPRDLSVGRPTTAAWLEWGGSDLLFATELAGGNAQLLRYRLNRSDASGDVTKLTTSFGSPIFSIPGTVGDGRLEMSLSATADRGLFVFRASTFDRPTEIYAAKPGVVMSAGLEGVMQLSHVNDGIEPAWGKSESMSWRSDKFRVQGWLMQPKDFDPAKKYPLIVLVHGGPSSAVTARWDSYGGLSAAAFSALGYFVLQPNPRGSFGQGEEFTQANRKDFGYGDLRDILAGVDVVLQHYPVDPDRVGITGWSYGGFMTMFAVTQTNRFKAAVAGAGIANWQSYYGENSIDQWMTPFFGATVYDDPAVYARSSAINYIKNVTTPTLVLVGDRDGECPAPQSFEFWHALRGRGVATQLVVYPNEGHGFADPAHRRDVTERAVEWFAHFLPPAVRSAPSGGPLQ
jgi:dipeptidyl aminopeptidase/acylaminoacyl peptidase